MTSSIESGEYQFNKMLTNFLLMKWYLKTNILSNKTKLFESKIYFAINSKIQIKKNKNLIKLKKFLFLKEEQKQKIFLQLQMKMK